VNAAGVRIRVWDLPTRIFHWALAILVVFSFTTGKIGGPWLEWHMRSGYSILALLASRLAWGVAGSRTSRFSSFVHGPVSLLTYARDLAARRHRPVIGHNPMGGWMVLLMLLILAAQAVSGLFADDEISTQGPLAAKVSNAVVARMSSFHSYNGWTIAVAVIVHVVAIAFYWAVLRDNLVRPMWTGWREVDPGTAEPAWRTPWLAAIFLAVSAAGVYWLVVVYPKG
jgi:cytochrome b